MRTLTKFLFKCILALFVASQSAFADFTPGEKAVRQVNNPSLSPTDASQCEGGSEIQTSNTWRTILLIGGLYPPIGYTLAAREAISIIRASRGWRCYEALCDNYMTWVDVYDEETDKVQRVAIMSNEPIVKCYLYPETRYWLDKRCNQPDCYHLGQTLRQGP
jgi:hypothetical protein